MQAPGKLGRDPREGTVAEMSSASAGLSVPICLHVVSLSETPAHLLSSQRLCEGSSASLCCAECAEVSKAEQPSGSERGRTRVSPGVGGLAAQGWVGTRGLACLWAPAPKVPLRCVSSSLPSPAHLLRFSFKLPLLVPGTRDSGGRVAELVARETAEENSEALCATPFDFADEKSCVCSRCLCLRRRGLSGDSSSRQYLSAGALPSRRGLEMNIQVGVWRGHT